MDEGANLAARAKAARDAGRTDAAIDLYARAAEHARERGDTLAMAHRLRHVGDIHLDAGRIERAAPAYAEALAIYRAHPQAADLDVANLLRPLAMLRGKLGDRDGAAAAWEEARDRYQAAGIEAGVMECVRHLAALRRG